MYNNIRQALIHPTLSYDTIIEINDSLNAHNNITDDSDDETIIRSDIDDDLFIIEDDSDDETIIRSDIDDDPFIIEDMNEHSDDEEDFIPLYNSSDEITPEAHPHPTTVLTSTQHDTSQYTLQQRDDIIVTDFTSTPPQRQSNGSMNRPIPTQPTVHRIPPNIELLNNTPPNNVME
jgi:hypothetical protein